MPTQRVQRKKLPGAWIQHFKPWGIESSWTYFDPTKHQPTIEDLNPFNNPYQHTPLFENFMDDQLNLRLNPQKVKMRQDEVADYEEVYEAQQRAYEAGLHFTAFDPFQDPDPESVTVTADPFQDEEQEQEQEQEVPPPTPVDYQHQQQNQMNVYIYNPGPLPAGEWIPQEWTEPDPEPEKPAWIPYEDQVHQYSGHPHLMFTEYGQFAGYRGPWQPFTSEAIQAHWAIERQYAKEGMERWRKEQKAARKAIKANAKAEAKINKEAGKSRAKALKEAAKALQPPRECWLKSLKPWWATGPTHVTPSRTWQYAHVGP